ncbi:MAG: hypothetical protein AB2A00_07785 [Myxococcota bacterium]
MVQAHPDLDAAKAALQRGEHRAALVSLERAERSPEITEEELVELHWTRGATYFQLGKTAEADRSFDALLTLRPLFEPNRLETPPDLRAAFRARAEAYQREKGVSVGAPRLEGKDLVVGLSGNVRDVGKVVAFVRAAGEATYRSFDVPLTGAVGRAPLAKLDLWEELARSGKLEVVVEARNRRGVPVARNGDAVKPLELPVPAAQSSAVIKELTPKPEPPPVAATPPVTAPPPPVVAAPPSAPPASPPPAASPPAAAKPAPESAPPATATPSPAPRTESPRVYIIQRPQPQAPAATTPAPSPPPAQEAAPPVAEPTDEEPPVKRVPVLAAGGGLLAVAAVALVVSLVAATGAAGSLATFGYSYYALDSVGSEVRYDRNALTTVFQAAWFAWIVFAAAAGGTGMIAVSVAVVGAAAALGSQLL